MDTVGTFEAKTHLTRLLDRVAAGEQITITRHGTPIARLVHEIPGIEAESIVRWQMAHVLGTKQFLDKNAIKNIFGDMPLAREALEPISTADSGNARTHL